MVRIGKSSPFYQKPLSCFSPFEKNNFWTFYLGYFFQLPYIHDSGIAFNESYIHSRTIYFVEYNRVWKDYSNNTKYFKIYWQGLRNNAMKRWRKKNVLTLQPLLYCTCTSSFRIWINLMDNQTISACLSIFWTLV